MEGVYSQCPEMESEKFLLRLVSQNDCEDLLRVYSDEKAVPLVNSDNCHGDDFFYTTHERMRQAIDFWLFSYKRGYFVRWSVIDKADSTAIGTIELFNRQADDFFSDCGILRLDLRSDYEQEDAIAEILRLILNRAFELLNCRMIATKAIKQAQERRLALAQLGFAARDEKLIGHDGAVYGDYYVLRRIAA